MVTKATALSKTSDGKQTSALKYLNAAYNDFKNASTECNVGLLLGFGARRLTLIEGTLLTTGALTKALKQLPVAKLATICTFLARQLKRHWADVEWYVIYYIIKGI